MHESDNFPSNVYGNVSYFVLLRKGLTKGPCLTRILGLEKNCIMLNSH